MTNKKEQTLDDVFNEETAAESIERQSSDNSVQTAENLSDPTLPDGVATTAETAIADPKSAATTENLPEDSTNLESSSEASREHANIVVDHISLDSFLPASAPEQSKFLENVSETDEPLGLFIVSGQNEDQELGESSESESSTNQTETGESPSEPPQPVLSSNTRHIVSARFNQMNLRLGQRISILNSWQSKAQTFFPHLNDVDDKSDYDKEYKEFSKAYRVASSQVNSDMKLAIKALEDIQADHPHIDVGFYIEHAFEPASLRDVDQTPRPDKKEKGDRELPGQQKIDFKVKDDGSQAEPASECVTEKVDPANIDEELAKRDSEPVQAGDCEGAMPEIDVTQAMIDTLTQKLKVKKKVLNDMWAAAGNAEAETDEQKLAVAKAVLFDLQQMELEADKGKSPSTDCAQECLEKAIEAGELPANIGSVEMTEHQEYLFDMLDDLDAECSDYLSKIVGFAIQMDMPDDELKARLEHPLIPTFGAENLATVCDKLENDYLAFTDKNSPPEKSAKAKQDKRPKAERKKTAGSKKK